VGRVRELDSTLLQLPGCAELTAAKLISETANMDRFRHEAAFARYVGVAPVPQSSGTAVGRVRASRSGNRQINTAIHRIAIVQLRLKGPGREYYQRRRAEGDSGCR
jgi:transposase